MYVHGGAHEISFRFLRCSVAAVPVGSESWTTRLVVNRVSCSAREKAERLAKLSVQDPILYAIERRREANEINNTKVGRLKSTRRPDLNFAASVELTGGGPV